MLLGHVFQSWYYYLEIFKALYSLNELISMFFMFSFAGWFLEVIYRSVRKHRFINPGFLRGPLVPLYGFAGLFILVTIQFTADAPLWVRLFIYFIVITIGEFTTGELVLKLFKRRLWDYSEDKLNLRGHVCLTFSLLWVILSYLFEKTLFPLATLFISSLDQTNLRIINQVAILILLIDLSYSSGLIPRFLGNRRYHMSVTRYPFIVVEDHLRDLSEWFHKKINRNQ